MTEQDFLPEKLALDWILGEELGAGGQASVHLLRAKVPGSAYRTVALKIFKGGSELRKERIVREIQVLREIDHPNVARLLDADHSGPRPWYIMPVYRGFKKCWKSKRDNLEPDQIFEYSVRAISLLCEGLGEFHRRGYVHRDIKPDNIQLSSKGEQPVLCDFGLLLDPRRERFSELDPIRKSQAQIVHRADRDYVHSAADDVFDLVAVWSWMLAERRGLDFEFYHWRYFKLIEHPKIDRMRAIWASCSDPWQCPANADELLQLIRGMFPVQGIEAPLSQLNLSDLAEKAAQTRATSSIDATQIRENAVALIVSCAPQLKELVTGLQDIGKTVQSQFANDLRNISYLQPDEVPSILFDRMPNSPKDFLTTKAVHINGLEFETDIATLRRTLILTVALRPEWFEKVPRMVLFVSGAVEIPSSGVTGRQRIHQINWWLWMSASGAIQEGIRSDGDGGLATEAWQIPPPSVTDVRSLLAEIRQQVRDHILG